jgi:hypothetical protein
MPFWLRPSGLADRPTLHLDTRFDVLGLDTDVALDPLSFTGIRRAFPSMQTRGEVRGHFRSQGTLERLSIDASLSGDIGTIDAQGYATLRPPRWGAEDLQLRFSSLNLAALTGREAASLSCTASLEPAPGDPVEISDRMTYEFGMTVRPENGTGRISVPIPGTEPSRRGWELAHWAVAHATELGIVEIGYQDRVWRSDRSTEGWRVTDASGSSAELLLSVAG